MPSSKGSDPLLTSHIFLPTRPRLVFQDHVLDPLSIPDYRNPGVLPMPSKTSRNRSQVRSIFKKSLCLRKTFSLPMKRQSQAERSSKDEHCLRWTYNWLGFPRIVYMCLDHC